MRKLSYLIVCLGLLLLVGCKEEQQKPEAEFVTVDLPVVEVSNVYSSAKKEELHMTVHHQVKDEKIYVECIVTPNFQFTQHKKVKKHGEGQVHLYLSNKKVATFAQGAFIIKDIPKGKHTITLKLIHNDQSEYGISETFEVEI